MSPRNCPPLQQQAPIREVGALAASHAAGQLRGAKRVALQRIVARHDAIPKACQTTNIVINRIDHNMLAPNGGARASRTASFALRRGSYLSRSRGVPCTTLLTWRWRMTP